MINRRMILYIALAIIGMSLWTAWQRDHAAKVAATETVPATPTANAVTNVPPAQVAQASGAATTTPTVALKTTSQNLIHVRTDTLDLLIDPQGGNIVQARLLDYKQNTQPNSAPVELLNNNPNTLYVAQSGLMAQNGPDTQKGQATYRVEKNNYELQPGQENLAVNLIWQGNDGVQVKKIFTFTRGKYAVNVNYEVTNKSAKPWIGQFYGQLQRKPEPTKTSIFNLHTFSGVSLSNAEDPFEKYSYSKLEDENIQKNSHGGWIAMQQQYFLSAWVPDQNQTNFYYSSATPNKTYTVGYLGPSIEVAANETKNISGGNLYVGPEVAENLKPIAPHLDLTIDYGWLWPISVAIFWLMKHINNWVNNWGWSIVLITLLIKIVFYKFSEVSYRSMAKMRKLTPKLQALKERYGDDKQRFSQATMELYRKEKVNPLSGCLPILIQIPFFIALYYVLVESVELRHAPFILWITDLSAKDPYYILPILMGLSMFIQTKLNPQPADPVQAKVMLFLPVVFTVFFLAFPAGLVLYWLVNNCLSILQQWYIMRRFEKVGEAANS